jgi:hypothetical protein
MSDKMSEGNSFEGKDTAEAEGRLGIRGSLIFFPQRSCEEDGYDQSTSFICMKIE